MNINEPISTLMTQMVVTVDIEDPLAEVEKLFEKNKIRHLPVTKNGKLVGILSQTDIMRLSFGDVYGTEQGDVDDVIVNMLTVNEVMKANPVSVAASAKIREAAEIFANNEFHALPVLEHGKLTGIITTTDIIKALLKSQ